MKVIDLLNKIANGEEVPKEIKYNACLFAFERQSQDYYCEEYGNLFEYLINEHRTGEFLNDEVEIIEEDKKIPTLKNLNLTKIDIDKRGQIYGVTTKEVVADIQTLQNWINKIINYINKEK